LLALSLLIVPILLTACGGAPTTADTIIASVPVTSGVTAASPPTSSTQAKTTIPAANTLKFKSFEYTDTQGTGIEAFSLLIPTGWQADAGITWVLDNPGMPATSFLKVVNSIGKEEFNVYPNQSFFWSDDPLTQQLKPIGSKYFGMEVLPNVSAEEALTEIVIPRLRPDLVDYQVIGSGLLENSSSSQTLDQGVTTTSEGAKIRLEYNQNGTAMEEEIYCLVEAINIPVQSFSGTKMQIDWYIDHIASFKAEKGQLDANTKLFQTMAYTLKLNPLWFSKYNQVINYLVQAQIQQIQSAGQLSRIIAQTNDEISSDMMDSYYQRQAVDDRIAEDFSQYMRGVDSYYDPVGQESVELPSGYQNAWANDLGEYILADSASFDPNVGSNLKWKKLDKK
jgi:hypothetical protein